jgi:hypothetical protein
MNAPGHEPVLGFSPAPHNIGGPGPALIIYPNSSKSFHLEVVSDRFHERFKVAGRNLTLACGWRYAFDFNTRIMLAPEIASRGWGSSKCGEPVAADLARGNNESHVKKATMVARLFANSRAHGRLELMQARLSIS